ncbi:substrate-binding domain-containing protein [Verrucomicrobiaceae bacterium R5-34]|uniref:Substrate-binding domain-containing protein n=1 Tax=Oceaniferula flava TaxID=2800421 RepID=A0AAE2SCG2_9BACT|nr:substrate-binding domain-containing protein [Oceaniferula flavus]MBK1831924.1 substrate-binding domain-containing protein [Verrucomicrobiaceae bacterium R5-34]MBK1855308.1 substrate-binding domain-containing protein [Oceaniferula flavus]MBM1136614.1 substrate-binding domain-containing protein [Oceaniferula flavus]
MPHLDRTSLAEQLARALSEEIENGVWTKRLPGYRVLGKRFGVSRPTCERALLILESNGLIGPAEPGKMRAVLRQKVKTPNTERMHLLIVIDSRHPPTQLDAALIKRMEDFWISEGGETSRVEGDLTRIHQPTYLLKKWLQMSGANCVLFETITPEWIAHLEHFGLHCYATGGHIGAGSGLLSGCGFKLVLCIDTLFRKLLALGHRRILLVLARATDEESMAEAIRRTTDPILAETWDGEEITFSIEVPDLTNPSDWHHWWQSTLDREQPSVVVTENAFQGLCLNTYCLERGIQMPRDMSIVVLEDADFLTWLKPPATRYRYLYNEAFRHFRDWVRGGFSPGSVKALSAEQVGGASLGPAPQAARSSVQKNGE